jgi:hypothetical protein
MKPLVALKPYPNRRQEKRSHHVQSWTDSEGNPFVSVGNLKGSYHSRVARWIASLFSLVDFFHGGEVQLFNEISYKVRQMSLWKPVLEGWWQEIYLIGIVRPVCLTPLSNRVFLYIEQNITRRLLVQ